MKLDWRHGVLQLPFCNRDCVRIVQLILAAAYFPCFLATTLLSPTQERYPRARQCASECRTVPDAGVCRRFPVRSLRASPSPPISVD
jgi:hypothetical protein